MIELRTYEESIQGKTYSLYGNNASTNQYYALIKALADACLERCPDINQLLVHIQKASGKKRFLKKQLEEPINHSLTSFVVRNARNMLSPHTAKVKEHLRDKTIFKLQDSTLLTTEEQYHLYMLEVELTNRIHERSFGQSETKLAFLPHCLRDLEANCRARTEPGDIDYTCKGCSKKCFINHVSMLLKTNDIKPYIWMDADLKSILKKVKSEGESLGVLGIACVPELVDGMRLCMRFNIPVVGIPLNANRCARWMGKFHPTSVNLKELEKLVG